MSTPDDATLGRIVREHKEKSTRVEELRQQLAQTGRALHTFGQALQQHPEMIQLGPGGFSMGELKRVVHPPDEVNRFNAEQLGALLGELRQLEEQRRRLREEAHAHGIKIE